MERWSLSLGLAARDLSEHAVRLMRRDAILRAPIDLSRQVIPRTPKTATRCHKSPIAPLSGSTTGTNLRQDPFRRQLRWWGRLAGRRPITAPSPLPGVRHQVRPDGVEHHIAAQLQQMGLLLHENRLEATLKQVPTR